MKKKNIICYVAGKSGGHIIPCLTLADEELKKNPTTQILFFTTNEQLDIEISNHCKIITWLVTLPLKTVSAKRWFNIITLLLQVFITIGKSFIMLLKHRPKKVISTGGFLAIPVVICARLLGIPVELYELNVQPGKATSFLTRWSVDLRICFAQTAKYLHKKRSRHVAYPIRFFDNTQQISQKEALQQLHLSEHRKTICILGGSQGSLQINRYIHDWITNNPHLSNQIQIIHQTGSQEHIDWQTFYQDKQIPAQVYNFSFDIALYYSAADLIICRSGAGTLFEVLFFGKPCITIPLETKENSHQVANALAMQEEYDDLFTVIRQKDIAQNKEIFYQKIEQLLQLYQISDTPCTTVSKSVQ